MMGFKQQRIAIVTRETRMRGLLGRWSTKGQARFVYQRARAASAFQAGNLAEAAELQSAETDDFCMLEAEDSQFEDSLATLRSELEMGLPLQFIDQRVLPTVDFSSCVVIVCLGQDGLVANTAKYAGGVPVVGVNPDPGQYDGILLPFQIREARQAVNRVLRNQAVVREVSLARATLHDGQAMLAFNDLFIGMRSHVSSRYELVVNGASEHQSSSGIIVSTAVGATGWMSSVFNMARRVNEWMGNETSGCVEGAPRWDDRSLCWVVREPFLSRSSGVTLACGILSDEDQIEIKSEMPTGGVIFSDGIETDFLEFNGGSIARIDVAPEAARLVVG